MKHTVTEIELKNGAKGLLIHVPDATVMNFVFNFRAGEYLLEPKKWETAHLMEHVLLGANELLPKARIFQAEMGRNGAYSNANTGTYDINYEAECADFEWNRILDLMRAAITKPLFLEEEFEAEFGNVKEELVARSNNHFLRLNLALHERYGFLAKTDQERVRLMKNVKLEDVRSHYKRTHTTKNMRFIIAGNLTPGRQETITTLLEKFDLPTGRTRFALPDERPKPQKDVLYIFNKSVKDLYFYVDTFMNRRLTDEESDALSLANTMLTETLYSKIFGTARERGLVYGMSSAFSQNKLTSNWWFGAQVSRKNAAPLFEIMAEEISKIFRGEIKAEDIEAAKVYSLGRFQRSAQTVGGTANGYGRYFFDEVVDDYYLIPKRIKAVTKGQIVEIVSEMFRENVWGMGVLTSCDRQVAADLHAQISQMWQK